METPPNESETGHIHSMVYEKKTKTVVLLTAVTMFAEIAFGYMSNSMALLADGWHMSSHTFAIGLTWIAYIIARKYSTTEHYNFSKDKLLALSGFTSAVVLSVVAILIAFEAIERLVHPLSIEFGEAIIVSVIGLIVNGLSAWILHHDYEHHDHNVRSAYLHVLADGLTSITAIIALTVGLFYNLFFLDAISGVISAVIIIKWAVDLIKRTGQELLDMRFKSDAPVKS